MCFSLIYLMYYEFEMWFSYNVVHAENRVFRGKYTDKYT